MTGKKHQEALKLVDRTIAYGPGEAVALAKKAAHIGFDETLELHLRMGVDPRSSTQQIRGVALLPHGLGKTVRVLVFAQGEAGKIATDAGADHVGVDDLVKKIGDGWVSFDVAIATPDAMGKLGKLGKILGRRGLMPNPKSGTVVQAQDLPRAIEEARRGRLEFKLDRTAIIHLVLGKVSFEDQKLLQNMSTAIEAVNKAKPSGAKGQYIRSAYLTTTMGPGIRLDLRPTLALAAS